MNNVDFSLLTLGDEITYKDNSGYDFDFVFLGLHPSAANYGIGYVTTVRGHTLPLVRGQIVSPHQANCTLMPRNQPANTRMQA